MSLDGDYEDNNIFAKILRGEIPAAKVYEDDTVMAFMDAFPQTRGHTLVVHKHSKARNLLDVDGRHLCELMTGVQKVARAMRAALSPDGIIITQFNGAPAGQTIFHLHVHIVPRFSGQAPGEHGRGQSQPGELQALARQIAAKVA